MNSDPVNEKEKPTDSVDLHLHTTASDGTFTPKELVRFSRLIKLKAIAITDHDSVAGIDEAMEAALIEGIEVIPGIELSTEQDDFSIHILGLFVDHHNKDLLKLTNEVQNAREERAKRIVKKINSLNKKPKISFKEVQDQANGLIARPHIGELLIKYGYAQSMDEAFEKYLKRGAPCYVPRFKLTPKKGIAFLRNIGAIPILAHPGLLPQELDIEEFVKDLVQNGLLGLEAYYPTHSYTQKEFFIKLAEKYDLLISGGSDCHGLLNNGPFVGSQYIPYSLLQKMKDEKEKR
ncbi:MAG: PHP domain-containing protein [Candidatus Thorarchaeota archaeon]